MIDHRRRGPLRDLGDHAATRGVKVLIESHDDWVVPAFLRRALEAADHPNIGALWDIHHPYRIAGISINDAWEALGPWVAAIDVKDSREDFTARLGYRYVKIGEGERFHCAMPWLSSGAMATTAG